MFKLIYSMSFIVYHKAIYDLPVFKLEKIIRSLNTGPFNLILKFLLELVHLKIKTLQ